MTAHTIITKSPRRPVLLVGAVAVLMLGIAAPARTSTGPEEDTQSTGPKGPTATLTGNGVISRAPTAELLTLSLSYYPPPFGRNDVELKRKLKFVATTNHDSTLVVGGSKIKTSTKRLAADEPTIIKAKLKHPKRLNEKACPSPYGRMPSASGLPGANCREATAKIKVEATDEFGQTAADELKFWFYKNPSL